MYALRLTFNPQSSLPFFSSQLRINFRDQLKNHNWPQYKDKFVALTCTADAIVPTWAYMLIASKLEPFAKKIVFGDLKKLQEELFHEKILMINPETYRDQRVVIKGCSKVEVPASAYVEITSLLRPYVKSIMYGEPCSTVPVYKAGIPSKEK